MSDEKQISLDDILNQAIDAPTPESAVEVPVETSAEPAETAEAKAERERDERGRFKAKTTDEIAETAAPEAPSEPVASTEAAPQNPEPEKAKPAYTEGHFRGWSQEQRAKFEALPPEAQETVLALKRDTDAHYTRKLEEAAQTKKQLEPVSQLLNQTSDIFAASGMDPVQAIQGYANIERVLTFGTLQEKLDLLGADRQAVRHPVCAAAAEWTSWTRMSSRSFKCCMTVMQSFQKDSRLKMARIASVKTRRFQATAISAAGRNQFSQSNTTPTASASVPSF
jgi:hypothetical protein